LRISLARSERCGARKMAIIDEVSRFSNSQLAKIFFNALRIRSDEPLESLKRKEAMDLLSAISQEWADRIAKAESMPEGSGDLPEKGMLATLGYHVGHSGEKGPTRRRILDYLMTEQLPMVDNPVYVAEWGDPFSKRRLDKFCRTIKAFIRQNKNRSGMQLAVAHWQEDLSWALDRY
jgi:hypothetical protein